ncbi:hypothetical protein K438DRAFT_1749380 [Mycena galopus ATCC 62051]|nr:hypothetical protein K438DRAFT_1749380 [Mycena galopus ATCC 62051]
MAIVNGTGSKGSRMRPRRGYDEAGAQDTYVGCPPALDRFRELQEAGHVQGRDRRADERRRRTEDGKPQRGCGKTCGMRLQREVANDNNARHRQVFQGHDDEMELCRLLVVTPKHQDATGLMDSRKERDSLSPRGIDREAGDPTWERVETPGGSAGAGVQGTGKAGAPFRAESETNGCACGSDETGWTTRDVRNGCVRGLVGGYAQCSASGARGKERGVKVDKRGIIVQRKAIHCATQSGGADSAMECTGTERAGAGREGMQEREDTTTLQRLVRPTPSRWMSREDCWTGGGRQKERAGKDIDEDGTGTLELGSRGRILGLVKGGARARVSFPNAAWAQSSPVRDPKIDEGAVELNERGHRSQVDIPQITRTQYAPDELSLHSLEGGGKNCQLKELLIDNTQKLESSRFAAVGQREATKSAILYMRCEQATMHDVRRYCRSTKKGLRARNLVASCPRDNIAYWLVKRRRGNRERGQRRLYEVCRRQAGWNTGTRLGLLRREPSAPRPGKTEMQRKTRRNTNTSAPRQSSPQKRAAKGRGQQNIRVCTQHGTLSGQSPTPSPTLTPALAPGPPPRAIPGPVHRQRARRRQRRAADGASLNERRRRRITAPLHGSPNPRLPLKAQGRGAVEALVANAWPEDETADRTVGKSSTEGKKEGEKWERSPRPHAHRRPQHTIHIAIGGDSAEQHAEACVVRLGRGCGRGRGKAGWTTMTAERRETAERRSITETEEIARARTQPEIVVT